MSGDSVVPLPPRRPRARLTEDQFKDVAGSLRDLRVDGADLAAINRYLGVVTEMTQVLRKSVAEADRAAQTVDDPNDHRYGSLGHDEVRGVTDVSARLLVTMQTVDKNLAAFAEAVDHTAKAVTGIARLYQTTDLRNKLDAEQVRGHLNR